MPKIDERIAGLEEKLKQLRTRQARLEAWKHASERSHHAGRAGLYATQDPHRGGGTCEGRLGRTAGATLAPVAGCGVDARR